MEVLCRVICSDGPIDLPYALISDYFSFQAFYKNGKTQVTQEITDEAMTYRIPHLHLDCTVEMLQYLLANKITLTLNIICDHDEPWKDDEVMDNATLSVDGHPSLSVVDVLYYNHMYNMCWRIVCVFSTVITKLVDYIKEEMPTINPYRLVDLRFESPYIYDLDYFIARDLKRFQEGTLNPDLVDDLAEMIVPDLNSLFHTVPMRGLSSSLDYFLNKYTGSVEFGSLKCTINCEKCSMEYNIRKYDITKHKDCPILFNILNECLESLPPLKPTPS